MTEEMRQEMGPNLPERTADLVAEDIDVRLSITVRNSS